MRFLLSKITYLGICITTASFTRPTRSMNSTILLIYVIVASTSSTRPICITSTNIIFILISLSKKLAYVFLVPKCNT